MTRHANGIQEVVKVLSDPDQVDLRQTNVRLRIQLLDCLTDTLMFSQAGYLYNNTTQMAIQVLSSI